MTNSFFPRIAAAAPVLLQLSLAVAFGAGAWRLATFPSTPAKVEKPPAAAAVSKPMKEEELGTVVLAETAEDRLGTVLGKIESKPVKRRRVYGGEAVVPAGKAILVAAPLSGALFAPSGGALRPGQAVAQGQPILELLPLLSPEARASTSAALVDADGQVKNAETTLDAARIALSRAQRLLAQEAGSRRAADEAQAVYDLAAKTLEAAQARRAVLARLVGEVEGSAADPETGAARIVVAAPHAGLLRSVSAAPGQTVPAGAALFEIVDLSTLWVRTAVPTGDLDDLDAEAPALVGPLSAPADVPPCSAPLVAAPPTANPLSSTVDRFYVLENPQGRYIPGERMSVSLERKSPAESLTTPWSAVLFDLHGGAWVYERTAPRTYVRRRVVVRYASGADAVLASGPPAGTAVVAQGALELFAAETGYSK